MPCLRRGVFWSRILPLDRLTRKYIITKTDCKRKRANCLAQNYANEWWFFFICKQIIYTIMYFTYHYLKKRHLLYKNILKKLVKRNVIICKYLTFRFYGTKVSNGSVLYLYLGYTQMCLGLRTVSLIRAFNNMRCILLDGSNQVINQINPRIAEQRSSPIPANALLRESHDDGNAQVLVRQNYVSACVCILPMCPFTSAKQFYAQQQSRRLIFNDKALMISW